MTEKNENEKTKCYRNELPQIALSKTDFDLIVDLLEEKGYDDIATEIQEQLDEYEFIDEDNPEYQQLKLIEEEGIISIESERWKDAYRDLTVLNSETYEKLSNLDKPLLVMFTSNECPPCAIAKPILSELQEDYADQLNIGLLDLDNSDTFIIELTTQFNVTSIPAFFIVYNKKIMRNWAGITSDRPKEAIKREIELFLEKL